MSPARSSAARPSVRGGAPSGANPSSAGLGSALLIVGPEGLLAERAVAARLAAVKAAAPEVEVHQLPASELTAGQFTQLIGGSLFSSQTAVVLEDISALDPALFDLVTAAAADPADDIALVLTHPGGVKGKGLLDRLTKAKVEKVQAIGPKAWEVGGFVTAEARRVGVRLDDRASEALVQAVGADLRALAAAVEQLAADADGQTITSELVGRYFAGRAEVSSFKVTDDVMAGRTTAALEKLRWALETGVPAVLVTSAIAAALRSVGKFYDLQGSRMSDADLARELGVPPWKVKDISRQARAWSPRGIATGITAVAKADAAVKGAESDPDFALEQLLLALDRSRQLSSR